MVALSQTQPAQPQTVRWGPSDALPAGIWINSKDGDFIRWSELQPELEQKLLNQVGQRIPVESRLIVKDFNGRKDWIMRILNSAGEEIGSVWLGNNPENGWKFDGLIRVGESTSPKKWEVWQTFQRFSDGSYRRV
ncbi:MAG: hypothetical protein V4481_01000 [Patescibacteria group bacterium]